MDSKKVTRKAKLPSKVRAKEEKETKKLFESIAKKLMKEQMAAFQVQIRSLLAANMDSVRHDIISIESSLSSRIITLESKVNSLSEKLEEITSQNRKSIDSLQEQQSSSSDLLKASLELERSKRTAHVKKLQEKISLVHADTQENLQTIKKEQENVVVNFHETFRAQAKDFSVLQEKVDELLISKFGYVPKGKSDRMSGGSASSGSASVLDQISQRMERIERAVNSVDDEAGTNLENSFSNALGSPSRHNLSYKGTMNRIRRLEENVQGLQNQQQQIEATVNQFRNNDAKSKNNMETASPETLTRVLLDVKDAEKKVKRLAENTSRACRSLSQGLSDVQQATLNLYTWSDQVHDTLHIVTAKIGLPEGMCDRAKVQRRRSKGPLSSVDAWDV